MFSISTNIVLLYLKKCDFQRYFKLLLLTIPFILIFAKVFGCLSGVYNAIGNGERITLETIKDTGIVYYGGLFGLILSYCIATKKVNKNNKQQMDILAVSIPLFHIFGRIGCYFSGCCYGKECKGIGSVLYTTAINGVENISYRIPVQLIEATFNLFLFVYLLFLSLRKDWISKQLLLRYLLIYSAGRFFLEFFRGDEARGIINGLSFSQFISVVVFTFVLIKIFYIKRKRRINYVNC